MFTKIEPYIKDEIEKVVFIELKPGAKILDEFPVLEGTPVPIQIKDLVKPIESQNTNPEFSLASMAKGMIQILGLDSTFKYNKMYKRFLYDFDDQIESYIAYEGLKKAEQKNLEDALIDFKALVFLNSKSLNALVNYARCCQDLSLATEDRKKKKDFREEAIEVLEGITEEYPDYALAYYFLGFHYVNENAFRKAKITWEKCLELDIDDEKRGEIHIGMDKIKDQVQYEEGYTYILNHQAHKGIEKLVSLVPKYKEWWNLLFFIGLGHRQLGQISEAMDYFKRIMKIKPTQVDTLNEIGLCYGAMNDFERSKKYFKKALRFGKEDSEILCNLGMVYMETKEINLAKEAFQKSIEMNPNDEITKLCLKKCEAYLKEHQH